MENNRFEIFIEFLRQLSSADILKNIVLVGDWCLPFYHDYFAGCGFSAEFDADNIEILIARPAAVRKKIDLNQILNNIGFQKCEGLEAVFINERRKLSVEFLISEKCKDFDRPIPINQLNIYAKPMLFLDFLMRNTIEVKVESFTLTVPHPVNFAIHKLFAIQKKTQNSIIVKDKQTALTVLKALVSKGEQKTVKTILNSLPYGWRIEIKKHLTDCSCEIADLFA